MMRAKLIGFMERPEVVARRYPPSDGSMAAQYARAISAYRFGNVNSAISQIDALIAKEPGNPYFQELKGQALLEAGRAGEAIAPLRKAVQMTNGAPLIRAMLGQALVQSGNQAYTQEAIRELVQATQRDPTSVGVALVGHGLRPLRRPRQCGSRLGACQFRRGRLQARPRTRRPRPHEVSAGLARLAQGRRSRELQATRFRRQPAMTVSRHVFTKEPRMFSLTGLARTGFRHLAARLSALALAAVPAIVLAAGPAAAFTAEEKKELGVIIREYLIQNPEVLQEAISVLESRQMVAEASQRSKALAEMKPLLLNSARGIVAGNPQGT